MNLESKCILCEKVYNGSNIFCDSCCAKDLWCSSCGKTFNPSLPCECILEIPQLNLLNQFGYNIFILLNYESITNDSITNDSSEIDNDELLFLKKCWRLIDPDILIPKINNYEFAEVNHRTEHLNEPIDYLMKFWSFDVSFFVIKIFIIFYVSFGTLNKKFLLFLITISKVIMCLSSALEKRAKVKRKATSEQLVWLNESKYWNMLIHFFAADLLIQNEFSQEMNDIRESFNITANNFRLNHNKKFPISYRRYSFIRTTLLMNLTELEKLIKIVNKNNLNNLKIQNDLFVSLDESMFEAHYRWNNRKHV
ncbi:MAG TPA: hypothetical protein PKD85_19965, partial [Saprospiraceae bacterium]|nr:hypothetical protein [Saprospiraceae bacterium]